jgi:oligopeptide/dipeptide ABC transporter ATP-binding protein
MSRPILQLDELAVTFNAAGRMLGGRSVRAVDGVDLTIEDGEILGLVGESGSGKTTLGKAILRLVPTSHGRILYRDRDITRLSHAQMGNMRRELQMVFQDPLSSFNPRHSVSRALATPLQIHKLAPPDEIDATIERLLTQVGLPVSFKHALPHEMSGGQLQRVAIARALALKPSLIVADEAVSKLDVSVRAQILNLLKAIHKKSRLTMIFITHDLHVARFLCDRIGVMYFGKLVEIGRTDDIFARPRHPYTAALLNTINDAHGVDSERDLRRPDLAFAGCRYHNSCPIRIDRCALAHPAMIRCGDGHQVACIKCVSQEGHSHAC